MNPREAGFLLLSSHLGDPERPVLTTAQLRILACRVRNQCTNQPDRAVAVPDLTALGYSRGMASRIVGLLEEEDRLEAYLRRGASQDCRPITRVSPAYPVLLRQRLGLDSPGCLWAKGDTAILATPAIALVGSRELREPNRDFARQVGREAALRGLTLISGNARGADRTAQQACLEAGGRVISIVADELNRHPLVRRKRRHLGRDYEKSAVWMEQRGLLSGWKLCGSGIGTAGGLFCGYPGFAGFSEPRGGGTADSGAAVMVRQLKNAPRGCLVSTGRFL